jgi:hypothetical protein
MTITLLLMRAILIIVCLETSARYWMWWSKVKTELGPVLPPLLLGIAVAQAGIAVRHMDVFYYNVPEHFFPPVLVADSLMLLGTVLHLIPCWRISHSFSERRIAVEIVLRGIMAVTMASAIVIYNLILFLK